MVRLLLRTVPGGSPVALEVDSQVRLRCMQPVLCRLFRKSFPLHRAEVVVGPCPHTHFHSQPFLAVADRQDDVDVLVVFERNVEDPFWYDFADRRMPRATVEDELAWDAAAAAGDAPALALGLEHWSAARRRGQKQPS